MDKNSEFYNWLLLSLKQNHKKRNYGIESKKIPQSHILLVHHKIWTKTKKTLIWTNYAY